MSRLPGSPAVSKDLGELHIGEINRAVLLPVSIGPYHTATRPQANLAHLRATSHPTPFDVITTACTNWKRNKSRHLPRKHSPSCSTTHSSTSSATRRARPHDRPSDPA
ncbi:hypothetical protein THAOC_32944 [Thalassiosira oceanica]|uniref:Uncharacterized protein n=1 Tax=Thalassiosira oceanica TaxID=159749 RepID=K0RH93_THAOC|nr:hypothetical protein THAOC_32944 [Thalassiosira oceanica]|eukprot:EJK48276.1 hypothetical protein THAOC_32944 [Thalassiosira oceanica]